MKSIVLIGPPRVGKTTVGALLATALGFTLIDTDSLLVEKFAALTPKDLYLEKGEKWFRIQEHKLLLEVPKGEGYVYALGGGAPTFFPNREIITNLGAVVYLKASFKTLLSRKAELPVFLRLREIEKFLTDRDPIYAELADYTIEIGGKSPNEVTRMIQNKQEILCGS